MLYEIINILFSILTGYFIYFPYNFIFFFILPPLVLRIAGRKYKPYKDPLDRTKHKVTVIIPEFNEDLDTFEKCVKSAAMNKPDELIVVHDDNRKDISKIAKKYGARVIATKSRLGKRRALILGWLAAKGDIIVQLDSDTIMEPGTLDEIIKPFNDPKVVGVQGHPVLFRTKSKLAYLYGQLVELGRDLYCKALSGFLPVIDGKIAAYRRSFLLDAILYFEKEKYWKWALSIADDKALTYYAEMNGWKTVYQSTAIGKSAAPETIGALVEQQLRWVRSGYLYLFKEIRSGFFFRAPNLYRFEILTYLFAPVSFLIALIQAIFIPAPINWSYGYFQLFTGINLHLIPYILIIFIVGLFLNQKLVFKIMGENLKGASPLELIEIGLFGLFVIFPMMLWALITHYKASEWRAVIGAR